MKWKVGFEGGGVVRWSRVGCENRRVREGRQQISNVTYAIYLFHF